MSDTKTYPLSAIIGEKITDKERIAELADAYNRLCAENADFVAESIKADSRIAELEAEVKTLREALIDMRSGWKYIREMHGDLYGVGWDRAQDKADAALAAREGK
jgi:hypothetical protein